MTADRAATPAEGAVEAPAALPLARPDGVVVVFPGQVFDAATVAVPLRHHHGDPLVDALADLLGTDAWEELDCRDPAIAGPCTSYTISSGPARCAAIGAPI